MSQATQGQSKKPIIIGVAAIAALLAAGGAYRAWNSESETGPFYKPVQVARGDIDFTILSTGVVQPENRVEVKLPIAGRVEEVLVSEGDYVKKGQMLAWMSSSERAALLDAASARGPEELKQWEDLYRPTPVLAPITGRIIYRNVEPGQTFSANDAILVMSDRLTVKAQVDETDIAQIKLKQKGTIVLDAYPQEQIPAVVDQIAFDSTTSNNVTSYIVDALPQRTPETMRSGMTANVTFQIERRANVLVIPAETVKKEKGRATVLVPGQATGPKYKDAVEREIKTGLSDGKRIEVVSGLKEGETVLQQEFRMPSDKATPGGNSPFAPGRPSGRGGSGRGR